MSLRPNQLYLSDLIFIALLIGVMCGLVLPALMSAHYPSDPGAPYPSVAVPKLPTYVFVGSVIAMLAGVLPCLLLVGGKRASHVERWVFAAVIGAVLCLLSTGISEFIYANFAREAWRRQNPQKMANAKESWVVNVAFKEYVAAQEDYAWWTDNDKHACFEYASSMRGRLDQFAIIVSPNTWMSRDSGISKAFWGEGADAVPCQGHVFKILTAQGPNAPGGRRSYIDEKGHMSAGHAMVAAPAVYGLTGTDTFIVGVDGKIFQRDFGDATPEVFKSMKEYDPDPKRWISAE